MNRIDRGIFELDSRYLDRKGYAACYVIENNGEIAIVETNTNQAIPRILELVNNLGFEKKQIKYVIITHVHLDHAGGAGALIHSLPRARLVVHSRGFRHMVDPEKLIDSVKQVYGDEKYFRMYGEVMPVPEDRIYPVKDYDVLKLGKDNLLFLDTPGHAKHHLVVFDEKSRSLFSGDAFGISYPRFQQEAFRLIFPSTAPVQFDPEKAKGSFSKIVYVNPVRILLTHFGSIENIKEASRELDLWIEFMVEMAQKRYGEGLREKALSDRLTQDFWDRIETQLRPVRGQGLTPEEKEYLSMDIDLNAIGVAHHIQKANN